MPQCTPSKHNKKVKKQNHETNKQKDEQSGTKSHTKTVEL
jgi:hypothetical protein